MKLRINPIRLRLKFSGQAKTLQNELDKLDSNDRCNLLNLLSLYGLVSHLHILYTDKIVVGLTSHMVNLPCGWYPHTRAAFLQLCRYSRYSIPARSIHQLKSEDSIGLCLVLLRAKNLQTFNYADYTSVSDGEENCELHNEIKNDDENPLEFLKDDRYTFYQIPGASHEPENKQKTENATGQVYICLLLPTSKLQSRSHVRYFLSNNGKERTPSTS